MAKIPTTLRRGSKGEEVRKLQTGLNRLGYDLVVDGDFGPKTVAAVRKFQREQGLSIDAIVGKNTWSALNREVLKPAEEELAGEGFGKITTEETSVEEKPTPTPIKIEETKKKIVDIEEKIKDLTKKAETVKTKEEVKKVEKQIEEANKKKETFEEAFEAGLPKEEEPTLEEAKTFTKEAEDFTKLIEGLPDEIKNDPHFQLLSDDLKQAIAYNYNIQMIGADEDIRIWNDALDLAQSQAEPYFENLLRVASDEVERALEAAKGTYEYRAKELELQMEHLEKDAMAEKGYLTGSEQADLDELKAKRDSLQGEYTSSEEKIKRSIENINQDLVTNKEYLSLEQQQDLKNLVAQYEVDLENLQAGAASAGLTFSTKRTTAESRLAERETGLVESTKRQYGYRIKQLELEAARGNIEAQAELADLERQMGEETGAVGRQESETARQYAYKISQLETAAARGSADAQRQLDELKRGLDIDITELGRTYEAKWGTEKLPGLEGYTPLGGVSGTMAEQKIKDIAARRETLYGEGKRSSLGEIYNPKRVLY